MGKEFIDLLNIIYTFSKFSQSALWERWQSKFF